jgi:hypothetical protein
MIKLKINKTFLNYKEGQIINLQTDNNGNVLDRFWRNRIKDSQYDNCCEIVPEKKKKCKKSTGESEL